MSSSSSQGKRKLSSPTPPQHSHHHHDHRKKMKPSDEEKENNHTNENDEEYAQRKPIILHKHAIQSIFPFLELHEFNSSSQLNHDWRVAATSIRTLKYSLHASVSDMIPFTRSPLRHCISAIYPNHHWRYDITSTSFSPHIMELLYQSLTKQNFNCLTEMVFDILADTDVIDGFDFPASITNLSVILGFSPQSLSDDASKAWQNMIVWMHAIARIPNLTSLHVNLKRNPNEVSSSSSSKPLIPADAIKPLLIMKNLRKLSCHDHLVHYTRSWGEDHIKIFRELSNLTELDIASHDKFTYHELNWLTTSHSLHSLTELHHCKQTFTPHIAECLIQLPSITKLHFERFNIENPSFLCHFKQLKIIKINFTEEVSCDLVVQTFQHLPLIEELAFTHPLFTNEHFQQFMPYLSKLKTLTLSTFHKLTSLEFLSSSPSLPSTLTSLRLSHCKFLTPSCLRSLRCLTALEYLDIAYSFPLQNSIPLHFTILSSFKRQ